MAEEMTPVELPATISQDDENDDDDAFAEPLDVLHVVAREDHRGPVLLAVLQDEVAGAAEYDQGAGCRSPAVPG